jgi:GH25 family lysozyme M1 (1,4-beta-N-acetylmuramidase)
MVFLEYVRDAGYEPMIYDSSLLFEEEYDLEGLTKYKTWVADYAGYPKYDYVFDIWQYTSSAALDGIDEPVDMNIQFVRK